MFVSKNRTLLLIALIAMISSANSFGAENPGWGNWFYNQLPSRGSLGYYGGSALSGLSPLLYTSDGSTYYPRYTVGSAGTQMLLDKYSQPTLEQQRNAQLIRGLSAALAAAALSRNQNNNWWDTLATAGLAGTAAGIAPSFIPSREERDRARLEMTENRDRVAREQRDYELSRELSKDPRVIDARAELQAHKKAVDENIKAIKEELVRNKQVEELANLIKKQNYEIKDEEEQQRKAEKLRGFFGY